jgi:acyl carrier protein
MEKKELSEKILRWVVEKNEDEDTSLINEDTDLFTSGYIDSMGFVGLMMYIEELSGNSFDASDINPDDIKTIKHIVELISVQNA